MLLPDAPAWVGDLVHLDAVDQPALVADVDGRVQYVNPAAEGLYRRLTASGGRQAWLPDLVTGGARDELDRILGQVAEGSTWRGRLEVAGADGTLREVDVTCAPLRGAGGSTGVLCLLGAPVEAGPDDDRDAVRRLSVRLALLARVAAELGAAQDVRTVTEVVISHLSDAVGATVASLSLVEGEELVLAGLRGGLAGADQRWRSHPISSHTPAADVVRSGEPLFLTGRDAIDAAYPHLEKAADGERSMVALPLKAGHTIGVVTLSFPGKLSLREQELEFIGTLADSCAQALERIRAQEEAAAQEARARFLARASAELASSLDYGVTLSNVAKMAVPGFADWCGVDLLEDGRLHRLAVQHVDPTKVQMAIDLERRYPADQEAGEGAWAVIESGESMLVPEIGDEMLEDAAKDEEHLRLIRALRLRSALVVPLVVRDRVLGAITWVMAESGRTYAPTDVDFAEELARRAAVAIDNSQLHSQISMVAHELQRAVLPDLPPQLPGWELTSCYAPAGRTEVGGDFFDAIPLPDGRLAIFVGDVMGRGVEAAAAMAQMRAAVRAYVVVDPDPEVVVEKMDVLFSTYDIGQLVTLVYVVLAPDSATFVNAGHLPPMVLAADGSVTVLPIADGPPLGVTPAERVARSVPLTSGCTLLAFTDGLVERRDEAIDAGLQRIRDRLPALGGELSAERLAALVDEVRDDRRDDDVAALAVRWTGPTG
ncbi:SpoIIE family protein phosphatase [Nocardioides panacisoli]|uniref:SpoIIE family protein phosphatase n=1 Tax=Nocardioides panacisoli TaxID=627624 RepID=UPI0031DC5815